MDRNTAVTTWREVCGSDMIMALPPTGRLLEEFARRIEAAEREACANLCADISDDYYKRDGLKYPELKTDAQAGAERCELAIRDR